MATLSGQIKPREIVQEMQESYLDYAMSVIISRALPDVRDGLKPVHRRILYAMNQLGLRPNAKFIKSARIVGECFTKDTLVLTSKGLKFIKDIEIGEEVYTQDGLRRVKNLFVMPPGPLKKITLSNGVTITATPSQKLKIFTNKGEFRWREVKNLKIGDWLTVRCTYPKVPDVVLSSYRGKEKKLSKELAYILGMLISDGWVTADYGARKHRRLCFVSSEYSIVEKIQKCFEKEFAYTPSIIKKVYRIKLKNGKIARRCIYRVRINRREINDYLINEFSIPDDFKATTKFIPNKIFFAPREVIFAFISGLLDGDGSIAKNRAVVNYASSSEELIAQLQILLQYLGIFSKRYDYKRCGLSIVNGHLIKGNVAGKTLEIRGDEAQKLAKEVNLASIRKQNRLNRIISENPHRHWSDWGILPYGGDLLFSELSRQHLGAGWYAAVDGRKFRMGIKYHTGAKIRYSTDLREKPLRLRQIVELGIAEKLKMIGSPLSNFIGELIDNDIQFLYVEKIEDAKPEITYDIEVENDHEFLANGVVAHNCMGKYHPHGDIAIYDSLVRMAQPFSLRYPLVDGQGNFGSIDGDPPSAMRYSEARLAKISEELLADIEKETVDFRDNYDATHKEPNVLPSRIPNLLINGSMGIAVGMATSIPPHNLGEVLDGLIYLIDNPDATVNDLIQFIKGPDFPTGGIIYNEKDILNAYATGKGPIVMRAKADIVEMEKGGSSGGRQGFQIIVSEIPYQVNKAELIAKIAELVKDKKIDGIKDIRDESDKEGLRIAIDLKQDAFPRKVLNQLFKYTELQKSFYVNTLALIDGIQPQILDLKTLLEKFIEHRQIVVRRRSQFDLRKAKERAHILEGLKKALDHIDEIIKLIKKSESKEDAFNNLIKRYKFTDKQATAILEMRLQTLAGLERKKIEDELREKRELIAYLEDLLAHPKKILGVIKDEFREIKEKYADERRTKIVKSAVQEIGEEELIPEQDALFVMTHGGYIKRMPPDSLRAQKRGGKGLIGIATKEEDAVSHFFVANTHDQLMFFTNSGKVFQAKGYEVPESTRQAKGKAIVNFLQISPQDKITAIVPISKKIEKTGYLVMVTASGIVKKVSISEFSQVRRSGMIAIKLDNGDELKWVNISSGSDEIMIVTSGGSAIRFKEKDVRPMGRTAAGVIGMRLEKNARVVGAEVIPAKITNEDSKLLVVMANGYGKRTSLGFYKVQKRGGKGITTAKITPKTGEIVSAHITTPANKEVIAISRKGQVIRTELESISVLGRATQGVRIMKMEPGDTVASVVVV